MKLSRFSSDKQDLIEQFVEYAQLMGLSGRDLVAIGGKLDRESKKEIKKANMAIVKSFNCLTIGNDAQWHMDIRFKLKTPNGAYNFEIGPYSVEIVSLKTKVKQRHSIDLWEYELPRVSEWRTRSRYTILLDIAAGRIKLDF
jgi:hypothetical protein